MLKIRLNGDIAELKEGLELVLPQLNNTVIDDSGIPVNVKRGEGLLVSLNENEGSITYSKRAEFFRAHPDVEGYDALPETISSSTAPPAGWRKLQGSKMQEFCLT